MRNPTRSDNEWMELITQCRQSGLTDHAWCANNGIPDSTFYNAVARLHKKACALPDRAYTRTDIDLTSGQDVVEIGIVQDKPLPSAVPARQMLQQHHDNSHMIEILLGPSSIRIPADADPSVLCMAIREIGRLSC